MNYAIVTVTSSNFVLGTEVLLFSFLKNNPWFKGDIIIINEFLTENEKNKLKGFPNVKFIIPGKRLQKQIDLLLDSKLNFQNKYLRFLSIESFKLKDYNRLLFLDSDIICLDSVKELFDAKEPLLACPDHRTLVGHVRNRNSFKSYSSDQINNANKEDWLYKTFNTGVMSIGQQLLNEGTYENLCSRITVDLYSRIESNQTDTIVLNLMFEHDVRWLDIKYNLFTRYFQNHLRENHTDLSNYKLIHFLGRYKPWDFIQNPQAYPFGKKAIQLWLKYLEDYRQS